MLCAERGRFLFEVRPDLFPEGFLTGLETDIWALYYAEREEQRKQYEQELKSKRTH